MYRLPLHSPDFYIYKGRSTESKYVSGFTKWIEVAEQCLTDVQHIISCHYAGKSDTFLQP
jgi:hypothetical protein